MTQLRCRLAPLIFLMRDSGLASTGPNLAKSTLGQGIRFSSPPPVTPPPAAGAPWALVRAVPAITALVKACTSSCVMRPLGPEPLTSSSGTPSSRANLRTLGLAWGRSTGAAVGLCAGAEALAAAGAGCSLPLPLAAEGEGEGMKAAAGAAPGDAAPPSTPISLTPKGEGIAATLLASSVRMTAPSRTLSPNLTFRSLTTPAWLLGISIDALSDSTVMSDCSTFTVSPGLTSSSMMLTSAKSPMSGILTSTNAIFVSCRFRRAAG